jgi:hypothetical protein
MQNQIARSHKRERHQGTIFFNEVRPCAYMSYGRPWAHYLGGYQDRLLGGPLGLLDLGCMTPVGVKRKNLGGEVLG